MEQAVDAALEMRNAIRHATEFKNYIIPVLALPDMDLDEAIAHTAASKHCARLLWRPDLDDLGSALRRIAGEVEVRRPPTMAHAANERIR